jgi:hypothetical protein
MANSLELGPRMRLLAPRKSRNFSRESHCRLQAIGAAVRIFGDYDPETMLILLWMRTAVRKEITSFGTFLSTLCHEFCHHLDFQRFGFPIRGTLAVSTSAPAALYHHVRGTPPKGLFWLPASGGCWRIDWPPTNRGI